MANRVKIAGYAKRIFFNDNIEYRNFSPDLVGLQLTSDGGTTLFTNGNFSIDVNLDPKPDAVFTQGTKSKYYTLDDVVTSNSEELIQKNLKTKLNLDYTNPLSYVWYGSTKELIKSSLLQIQDNWPAAIYVDNKVGSVSGNNITNYSYDISLNESTFTVNSRFFNNPYGIKYTEDAIYTSSNGSGNVNTNTTNPLRNFTLEYKNYVIEYNGISRPIKSITPATQKTNSDLEIIVEGNPFPELTGIYIPQYTFLTSSVDGSLPYFIKPKEEKIEEFFTSLNNFQRNILSRETYPKYNAIFISTEITDDGIILTTKDTLLFPVLSDGYNLNFFDTFYLTYLNKINAIGDNLDNSSTDLIVRKYTSEAISSFDTLPKGDANDYTIQGEKATKLLRIYGVEFDEIKKYINGIKFAHVVTYDKKNNIPDVLVKDLAYMLGLDPITFVTDVTLNKTLLPSNGGGMFSGTSTNLTQSEIDIELYRRLILNIAWLWKSKGSRKAVEFLFRFIGAPESLVNFNEYVVIVDKPLDMDKIKQLLYLYTGNVDTSNIPYDDNGFPLPPINGDIVITNLVSGITEDSFSEMYFQKAGGWYRKTFGTSSPTILEGNNPHIGNYDGGNEYLNYFSRCFIPDFNNQPSITITATTFPKNYFENYNYGIFNGVDINTSQFFTTQLSYIPSIRTYQKIDDCFNINYSLIETPLQPGGKTTFQQQFEIAEKEYKDYLSRIKQDSYLEFSPEWDIIKSNYDLASYNVSLETTTENCDKNLSLQICLDEIPRDNFIVDCSTLNSVTSEPFIYFVDDSNNKVSFDSFPSCCNDKGGKFISYTSEDCRTIQYCSKSAPCVGNPVDTTDEGIIVFEITNNTIPNDFYTYNGSCYQLTDRGNQFFMGANSAVSKVVLEPQPQTTNIDPQTYLNTKGITPATLLFFKKVSCSKTIVSSPECCAWYGYNSKIVSDGTKDYIVCLSGNSLNTPTNISAEISEEIKVKNTQLNLLLEKKSSGTLTNNQLINLEIQIDQLTNEIEYLQEELDKINSEPPLVTDFDVNLNNSYTNLQNPIGGVNEYYSTKIYKDSFDIAKLIVGNGTDCYECASVVTNALFDDPSFNNPANWKVYSVDQYSRVSFTPKTFQSDFVLDWYATGQLSQLYENIANLLGYVMGSFYLDPQTNSVIPYKDNGNLYSNNPNSITRAAVDPERIGCGSVNDVSIVFGSNNWNGFKLPKLSDCSATVDFTFDYMLKFDVDKLKECQEKIDETLCFPALLYDNSFNHSPSCFNFAVFTNSQNDSTSLENNFFDQRDKTSNYYANKYYQLWQNTNILEPDSECCNAIGGTMLSVPEYLNTNSEWYNRNKELYTTLTNNPTTQFLSSLNFSYDKIIELYNNMDVLLDRLKSDLSLRVDSATQKVCYNILISEPECPIKLDNFIYTENVCGLDMPNNVATWNNLYWDYQSKINSVTKLIQNFELKCSDSTSGTYSDPHYESANEIALAKGNLTRDNNNLIDETNSYLTDLEIEKNKINLLIQDIDNEINQKISENISITTAKSNIDNTLNCNVYQNKIDELTNFDVENYCKVLVYGDDEINDLTKINEYNECVTSKNGEIKQQLTIFNDLLNNCIYSNTLKVDIEKAKFDNNSLLLDNLVLELEDTRKNINTLTTKSRIFIETDASLVDSTLQINDYQKNIDMTAELLGVNPSDITNSYGNIDINDSQKVSLQIILEKNKKQISDLRLQKNDLNQNLATIDFNYNEALDITNAQSNLYVEEIDSLPDSCDGGNVNTCCDPELLDLLYETLNRLNDNFSIVEQNTIKQYDNWYNQIQTNYSNYIDIKSTYLTFINNLKLNFKLFVDNNNSTVLNNIDSDLTYLPYTESVNPIWEFSPTDGYSGIILEGNEQLVDLIKEDIFNDLSLQNKDYNSDLFEPSWKTFKYNLPECVCDDLRRLYPNKEFFFSIEIENYSCSVCLLVDNIQVNVSDCKTNKVISLNDCMIPQLSCVIDNKKSWVYYDSGIVKETVYPNGECNQNSVVNYEVLKVNSPEERLYSDLEYRYTNYDEYHSDLVMNVKNTTFSIDPAKAIECDVFNYWRNIDCDNCPTSCDDDGKIYEDGDDLLFMDCNSYIFEDQSTILPIVFSGSVYYSSTTLTDYSITLEDVVTSGLTFNCQDYIDILNTQVVELKNKYYTLTGDYSESLSSTYYGLLEKGETLSKFYIDQNNCDSETIVINNNKELDNLFGIISENYDGSISFFEIYLYSGTTPYVGGEIIEVFSGLTAQTYNQTSSIDAECCSSLNNVINGEGSSGLGVGKTLTWDESTCRCYWSLPNNCSDCKGDCEYCGSITDVCGTNTTSSVCVNPLNFLDILPSEINVKDVFDNLVITNLIDAKSRQTISGYPLLMLFYELYLNASNCGADISGHLTYDNLFEFMDKIGDYWLDLLEQVVPSTTIWEGCDNSGKIYRNTIFDQNKFTYKKYSLNFLDSNDCIVSGVTDFSIGSSDVYSLVEQVPIYPDNTTIRNIKNSIRLQNILIANQEKVVKNLNKQSCALNLQDVDTPNLQTKKNQLQQSIDLANSELIKLNTKLNEYKVDLINEEEKYIKQQNDFVTKYMSCSGITSVLKTAQEDLSKYTPGTTNYEKQRNYISILNDKYDKCVRQGNILISDYNKVFITQIYDTNEYEGNVTIIGDPDWEEDGPFYNKELIHNCTT